MQDIRIDSHKLMFHPERVADWLEGKSIYPISVEISPSSVCNHRCIFCAVDYVEHKPINMDSTIILSALKQLREKGLKSVVISGEGEPFANKSTPYIIKCAKEIDLDIGLATNGVLFTKDKIKDCLGDITWIRFSVAAGTKENYAKIHATKEEDFALALGHIAECVNIKKENRLNTTIGVQLLLIPENVSEVVLLAKELKEIGVDYYTVKPYSKHPSSINTLDDEFDYDEFLNIENELKKLETEIFKVYFRSGAMKKLKCNRKYNKCHGLDFFTHIDSSGNVIPCIMYYGNDEFKFGNIYENTIDEIWENKIKIVSTINSIGTGDCREICRLDEINKYLHDLKNPGEHVNFI